MVPDPTARCPWWKTYIETNEQRSQGSLNQKTLTHLIANLKFTIFVIYIATFKPICFAHFIKNHSTQSSLHQHTFAILTVLVDPFTIILPGLSKDFDQSQYHYSNQEKQ